MTKWVCPVCGYVHEGDTPPEKCPVCKVPGEKFNKLSDDAGFACGLMWTTILLALIAISLYKDKQKG